MKESVYDRIRDRISPERKNIVLKKMSLAIVIHKILEHKGWTNKDFAEKLEKTEEEIEEYLSGLYEFTEEDLNTMEKVVGFKIANII